MNFVSWLPPLHPQAKPSLAASVLREQNKLQHSVRLPETDSSLMHMGVEDEGASSDDSLSTSSDEEERPPPKRRGHMPKRDVLDPMDPAAYSECPRFVISFSLLMAYGF
jgi:hypothetical protein